MPESGFFELKLECDRKKDHRCHFKFGGLYQIKFYGETRGDARRDALRHGWKKTYIRTNDGSNRRRLEWICPLCKELK